MLYKSLLLSSLILQEASGFSCGLAARPVARAAVLRMSAAETASVTMVADGSSAAEPMPPAAELEGKVVTLDPVEQLTKDIFDARDNGAVLTLVKNNADCTVVHLAAAMHKLAVINKKRRAGRDALLRDTRFENLIGSIMERAKELDAASTADVLWSSATLQHWPATMLTPILTAVNTQLDAKTFEAKHLSSMTWALAKLQTKPVKLLEKIEAQAIPLLSSMDMHNCANLLWGFATLRYPPKELLQPMVTSMIDRGIISGAKPVEVADLSTALSVLAKPGEHAELLLTLANRAAPDGCLEGFSSRQIVKLLSVYTKLEAVAQLPEGRLDQWVLSVRKAHGETPLMARDANDLEDALNANGIECGWIKSSEMLFAWTSMAADGESARKGRDFTDEELKAAFDSIDTDGSGDIDEEELRTAIRLVNPNQAESTMIDKMLALADSDGDKEVSFDEFKQIMRTVFGRAKSAPTEEEQVAA